MAAIDAESFLSVVPDTVPGGKPVIDVPGDNPMSPEITDAPVLVIVDPARTAYGAAEPRLRAVAAKAVPLENESSVTKLRAHTPNAPTPRRTRE
jgi:hypothetical protein